MIAIISLLLVLTLSLLVTRVAAIALSYTGMSRESARFQARSAFTGVGYTTSEAERVVNHPVRRRILMLLMLFGNAGIVTAVSSLILTFISSNSGNDLVLRILVLSTGIAALWSLGSSRWVDRRLSRVIERALKRFTSLDVRDYASLLHIGGEYRVTELGVEPGDWLDNRKLEDLNLNKEGILVLGVDRHLGGYIGAPDGKTRIRAHDRLLLYGRSGDLAELDVRRQDRSGEASHQRAVKRQQRVIREEREEDPEQ